MSGAVWKGLVVATGLALLFWAAVTMAFLVL